MTTIIVTHEDNEVDEFEFESGHNVISIGRRSTNDVCIPNLSVSGNHARISVQGTDAWIEDLGSTNGSYVNGQLISRQLVKSGDDIILGKIRVAFLHSSAASQSAAAPTAQQETVSKNSATSNQANHRVPEIAGDFADDSMAEEDLSAATPPTAAPMADTHAENIPPAAGSAGINDLSQDASRRTTSDSSAHSVSSSATEDAPHPLDGIDRVNQPAADSRGTPPMHELDSPSSPSKGAVIEIKNGAKSGQILPIDKPVTTLGRPGIQIAAIMRKPDGYFLMHIESDDSVDRPTLNRDAIGDEPVLLHSGDELNVAGIDVEFMLS